jgi:hypothetical protein
MTAATRTRLRPAECGDQGATERPAVTWRLHGFQLDYDAALRAIAAGQPAANVARAAGSRASSRRNLQRVGLKIIGKLVSRGAVYETFCRLGYDIEQFCRDVIAATEATRTVRVYQGGRVVGVYEEPDWKAQARARDQYMRSIGLDKLPL